MPTIVALALALSAYGQDCGKDCQCILDNARRAAEQEQPDFQRALSLFNAAKLCFPDSVDIVQLIDGEVVDMFERINRLKEQADEAENRARKEAARAKSALDSVIILQKATEEQREKAKDAQKKIDRWKKVIIESCKQSERDVLLELHDPIHFSELSQLNGADQKFIATAKVDSKLINKIDLKGQNSIIFMIGAEGGFSEKEIENALESGFEPVNLGNNILRAETAAIYLSSIFRFLLLK